MQSLSSVMRVRPQKLTVNNTSTDEQKRHENTNSASEVILVKIKTNFVFVLLDFWIFVYLMSKIKGFFFHFFL